MEKEKETESEVVALARQAAAAAARAERAAHQEAAAMRPVPVRKYRGVQRRRNRYCATVWNGTTRKQVWLGSYATPEEAAYAYDAAARRVQGRWAKPNFPNPSSPPPPPPPCQAVATTAPTLTSLTLALRALQARNNINHLLPMPALQLQLQPQRQPLLHPCWAPPPPAPPRFVRLPLPGPAAGASAPNAAGLYRSMFPSIPGGYVPASLEELRLNWPSSSEESSTEPPPSSAAAAVLKRRGMAVPSAMALEDGSVVGDNFSSDGGASSSSVASTSGRWW